MAPTPNDKTAFGTGAEGARELSEALKVNTTLQSLGLMGVKQQDSAKQAHDIKFKGKADHMTGDEGTCALGEALKVNATLTTLSLASVQSTTRECQTSTQNQPERQTGIRIGDKGMSALSEALKVNTTLKTLELSGEQSTPRRMPNTLTTTTPTTNRRRNRR